MCKAKGFHEGNGTQRAVYKAAKHCTQMYKHFNAFDPAKLVRHGEWLMSQYMALEEFHLAKDADTWEWHSKPKMHLLGHILDQVEIDGLHPRGTWNYKDETEAKTWQGFFFRRGGQANPGGDAEMVLLRWMQDTPWLAVGAAGP